MPAIGLLSGLLRCGACGASMSIVSMKTYGSERWSQYGLDWTIARPPRLTNGALTRAHGVADGRMPPAARLTISRADVADFLLGEVEHPAHVRRIVGLASTKSGATRAS